MKFGQILIAEINQCRIVAGWLVSYVMLPIKCNVDLIFTFHCYVSIILHFDDEANHQSARKSNLGRSVMLH